MLDVKIIIHEYDSFETSYFHSINRSTLEFRINEYHIISTIQEITDK